MIQRLDFLEKVRPFVGLDVIKVLTGMRRSGKSVLMEQIREMIRTHIDPKGNFVFVSSSCPSTELTTRRRASFTGICRISCWKRNDN